MRARVGERLRSPWLFPVALLMVGVAAHGLLIPTLGFYWNDWQGIYFNELNLPAIGFQYYAERPLNALIYLALFPITGSNPVAWQVTALLLRWGGLLFVYYTFNLLWPEHRTRHRWIVALLFVFPGYFLQPVSVAFSPHLVTFALYASSLLLMVAAIKKQAAFWPLMSLSLILSAVQMFSMEYFVGLELIRPLLILWAQQSNDEPEKSTLVGRTILYWSPFVLLLGVFLVWRLLVLPISLEGDPNHPVLLTTILRSPVDGLTTLLGAISRDIRHLLFDVWLKVVWNPDTWNVRSRSALFSLAVGAVTAVAYALYQKTNVLQDHLDMDDSLGQLALLGMTALVAGGLPFWLLGRQLTVGMWSDRFALPTMLGAVVLVVCAGEWLLRTGNRMGWVMAALLGFSIVAHVYSTNKYRHDWEFRRNLFWELIWRIPELREGTALYGRGVFSRTSAYVDATYVVNLLFDPEVDRDPEYAYFDRGHFSQSNLMADTPMIQQNRAGEFIGSTSRLVAFYHGRSACARVLDKVYMGDPNIAHHVSDLGLYTNLDQILATDHPATLNSAIFGPEPSHGWCYYFEKGDLSRQLRDWQGALDLLAVASSMGLEPAQGAEYIPFIEALARKGRWYDALELSYRALEISPGLEFTLCRNWDRFDAIEDGPAKAAALETVRGDLCTSIEN